MPKRKPARRPSPRHSSQRDARRADRQATRRKLAIVEQLAGMPGVRTASGMPSPLMVKARESAAKYKAPDRETWFTRFAARNAEGAAELRQVVVDWVIGGEMREHYPTLSHLHRFVDHEVCRVDRQAFSAWLKTVEATL